MGRVAVLGLGRMGAAMAGTLARVGFDLVVWNRTPARAEEVSSAIGARMASTAAEAVADAAVVVSSLADDAALIEVHTGSGGTLEGMQSETVVVETSTVDPTTVIDLARRFSDAGGHLLDSPVSGSVALVEQGALTSMVGGDSEALERARPVINALSKAVFHLGSHGAGATMKLAVNAFVHAINLALSEALVLAEQAGIDRHRAYEVFANGAGASPFVLYKREAFERPDETPVGFSVELMAKDLDLILTLAERLAVPMEQGRVTAAATARALQDGFGERDMSSLAVHLRAAVADGAGVETP